MGTQFTYRFTEDNSPSKLNPEGLDATATFLKDGHQEIIVSSVSEPEIIPFDELRAVVLGVTGSDRAYFPKEHHREYFKLLRLFGRDALLKAMRVYCTNQINNTYDIHKYISSGFLASANTILVDLERNGYKY